jgi:glycosyltransferase involved in cell wall biosynthesis/SAM-dependent methyltransferase
LNLDDRARNFLAPIDLSGRGLEIGPSYSPLLPKSAGFKVETLDYLSEIELQQKYRAVPEIASKLGDIEPVDYVTSGRSLLDAIAQRERFDFIVASHVIEHMPDLLKFLQDCEALLKPNGVLALAIPDKRYCFDVFQPLSSIGQVLDVNALGRTQPSPGAVFDYYANSARREGRSSWPPSLGAEIQMDRDFESAGEIYRRALRSKQYFDVHVWRFVPSSFQLIISDLVAIRLLGLADIKLKVDAAQAEFFAYLRKGQSSQPVNRLDLHRHILVELLEPGRRMSEDERANGERVEGGSPNVRRIAAVIPLYNGSKYIEAAIDSVFGQTRLPEELIVVDDGSTDDSAEIVARMSGPVPITLLRKENGGQSSARNWGVRHAATELVAFLDQDDIWYPRHLELLEEPFLKSNVFPPVGWAYSNLDEIDENGAVVNRRFIDVISQNNRKERLSELAGANQYVLPSASLLLKSAIDKVGGFDSELTGYEDDDLFIRMFRAGYGNVYIGLPLSAWRIHSSSSSYSFKMARSRIIFAHKLLRTIPDDEERNLYYSRDIIVPRFMRELVYELTLAGKRRRRAVIEQNLEDIHSLLPYVRSSRRWKIRLGLQVARLATALHAYRLSATAVRKANKW